VPSHSDAGLTQLVECQLPKLDVAGSSPVSRSRAKWVALLGRSALFLSLVACLPESEEVAFDQVPSDGELTVLSEGEKGLKRLDPRNGWWPSAAFSDDGVLHVGWCNGRTGYVWYARQGLDGKWTKKPIDTSAGAGRYVTMTLGRDGRPIFAYQVQEEHIYRLLRQTENGWQRSLISKNDGDGRGARLIESQDGRLHLLYYGAELGIFYSHTDAKGVWHREVISKKTQGSHTVRPDLHIHGDGRVSVMFGDVRMVKTGLQRAERNAKGKWTVTSVDRIHSPGRSVVFIGEGKDPTDAWVYTVNGRAWIKLGAKNQKTRWIARHASLARAGRDPDGKLVILTAGTDRSLTHLTRHAYLIRFDKRHGKYRHFKIGDANVVHADLAISKAGRIVSVVTHEKDGTLYVHALKPGQY
jgi:hypothetical protein